MLVSSCDDMRLLVKVAAAASAMSMLVMTMAPAMITTRVIMMGADSVNGDPDDDTEEGANSDIKIDINSPPN